MARLCRHLLQPILGSSPPRLPLTAVCSSLAGLGSAPARQRTFSVAAGQLHARRQAARKDTSGCCVIARSVIDVSKQSGAYSAYSSGSRRYSSTSQSTTPISGRTNTRFKQLAGGACLVALGLFFLPDSIKCDEAAAVQESFPTLEQVDEDSRAYQTREEYLLSISEDMDEQQHDNSIPQNSSLRKIYTVFESIYDSIATWVRFAHLVLIFLPVAFTSPAILFGSKLKDSDTETTGSLWWYRLLIYSMESAGPTFIKLGQWAASRTDIFPRMFCIEMSKLHSSVKKHSLSVTIDAIEDAFHGAKFRDIFEEFEEEPLGIGAIAQVYRAKLSPDILKSVPNPKDRENAWVAVKVLHPHVESRVHRDLRIMEFFAWVLDKIPTIEWLSLPGEVEQFGTMMKLQMDLRIESTNLAIFQRNFNNRENIHFPVSYSAILPNMDARRVLIEEYVPAIPMDRLLSLPSDGRGQVEEEIADMGLNAFLNMLLIDNFVHADLHPGNIMVRFVKKPKLRESLMQANQKFNQLFNRDLSFDIEATNAITKRLLAIDDPAQFRHVLEELDEDGYRPQVVFLDAGLVTELNAVNRRNFLDLFTSLATFDGYRAGELMIERSRTPQTVINGEVFALRMQRLLLGVKSKTFALGNMKIGDILQEVLSMIRNHHVRMESDFVNVVLSVLLLEGIGRQLDPNLDIFKSSLPILRRLGAISAMSGNSDLLSGQSVSSMVKVWVALEAREFVTASASDIKRLVKYDLLCPNV